MKAKPKSKMDTITDEVAQLHPLLKLLLKFVILRGVTICESRESRGNTRQGAEITARLAR